MPVRLVVLWMLLNWLIGRVQAVYHAGRVPNRRDAIIPCGGVAFWTRGPMQAGELPATCWTCSRPLKTSQLDWREVVARQDVTPIDASASLADFRHGQRMRAPRHVGQIVTEQSVTQEIP